MRNTDDPLKESRKPSFQVTDKRFWVEKEQTIEDAKPSEKRYPSVVVELQERVELAESKLKEKIASLENDNQAYRGRLKREMEQRLEAETLEIIESFLEVLDNLERAVGAVEDSNMAAEGLCSGVELNVLLFRQKLAALGVEILEPIGQSFDPELAEAVGIVPVEDQTMADKVVTVLQKGYRRGDRLLRPARVQVGQLTSTGS